MNIYVGNLSYSVTESDLKDAFSQFGQVSSVSVVTDKFSGQSKGFGFVEMPSNAEADAAIKGLNERDIKGRNIKVNQAKPREERPARRPVTKRRPPFSKMGMPASPLFSGVLKSRRPRNAPRCARQSPRILIYK